MFSLSVGEVFHGHLFGEYVRRFHEGLLMHLMSAWQDWRFSGFSAILLYFYLDSYSYPPIVVYAGLPLTYTSKNNLEVHIYNI